MLCAPCDEDDAPARSSTPLSDVLRARCEPGASSWRDLLHMSVVVTLRHNAERHPFVRADEARMMAALEEFLASTGETCATLTAQCKLKGTDVLSPSALMAMLADKHQGICAKDGAARRHEDEIARNRTGPLVLTAQRVDPNPVVADAPDSGRPTGSAGGTPREDRDALVARLAVPKAKPPAAASGSPRDAASAMDYDASKQPTEPCLRWLSRGGHHPPRQAMSTAAAADHIGVGVWSCCGQRNPYDQGCEAATHTFDIARCKRCGLWVQSRQKPKPPPTPRDQAGGQVGRRPSARDRARARASSTRSPGAIIPGATRDENKATAAGRAAGGGAPSSSTFASRHALSKELALTSGCRVRGRSFIKPHCPMAPPDDIECGTRAESSQCTHSVPAHLCTLLTECGVCTVACVCYTQARARAAAMPCGARAARAAGRSPRCACAAFGWSRWCRMKRRPPSPRRSRTRRSSR